MSADWPTPADIENRLRDGTAELVYGRMPHCPQCGGRLVPVGTVGFWGNGDPTFAEKCARGCSWSQEVRVRRRVVVCPDCPTGPPREDCGTCEGVGKVYAAPVAASS